MQDGATPLHLAAVNGRLDCVRLLAQASGAAMALLDVGGRSPLHHAIQAQSPDCIEALIAAGAQVEQSTSVRLKCDFCPSWRGIHLNTKLHPNPLQGRRLATSAGRETPERGLRPGAAASGRQRQQLHQGELSHRGMLMSLRSVISIPARTDTLPSTSETAQRQDSPLGCASVIAHKELLQLLIDFGADVKDQSRAVRFTTRSSSLSEP